MRVQNIYLMSCVSFLALCRFNLVFPRLGARRRRRRVRQRRPLRHPDRVLRLARPPAVADRAAADPVGDGLHPVGLGGEQAGAALAGGGAGGAAHGVVVV